MRPIRALSWRIAAAYAVLLVAATGGVAGYAASEPGPGPVGIAVVVLLEVAAAVALAHVVGLATTRSVKTIVDGVHRLAAGDLQHRIGNVASVEAEEMAEAFNRMADSLHGMVNALTAEQGRLAAVLDTMADAVVVVDRQGQVSLVNPAAEELFGVETSRAVGNDFVGLVRDHELQQLVAECREGGQRRQAEVELLQGRRYLSAIATPLSSAGSAPVLLTLHDLTRMRQVEATRREFVGNISHELRSPLSAAKAMIETLDSGTMENAETARDFVARVHREIDRMIGLVHELMELSRLESDPGALELVRMDLAPLIREVADQFRQRALSQGVELTWDDATQELGVLGDEVQLRRVLVNLVDNAVRACQAGGSVSVATSASDGKITVSVTDTGVGIGVAHLPHVFERFYKVDRSRRDDGTGLGLAIAKHIVQAHGGDATASSREGEGSVFSFTLPATQR